MCVHCLSPCWSPASWEQAVWRTPSTPPVLSYPTVIFFQDARPPPCFPYRTFSPSGSLLAENGMSGCFPQVLATWRWIWMTCFPEQQPLPSSSPITLMVGVSHFIFNDSFLFIWKLEFQRERNTTHTHTCIHQEKERDIGSLPFPSSHSSHIWARTKLETKNAIWVSCVSGRAQALGPSFAVFQVH